MRALMHLLILISLIAQCASASEGFVLDRHGEVISHKRVAFDVRQWPEVKLGQVSDALKKAVLESEDRSFYSHHGVDWPALVYSGARSIVQPSFRRGASTLTMQWVGLENKNFSGHRNWSKKIDQVKLALEAEKKYSKDEIFEKYLNRVDFRGEYRGVHAASRCLFQKHPSLIDPAEAAILAVLIRSPNASAIQIENRAKQLNEKMGFDGSIKKAMAKIRTTGGCLEPEEISPALGQRLLSTEEALVRTPIDSQLQRKVREIVKRQLSHLKDENVKDAAVVVIENKSGEVLAYEAGSGIDLAYSKRQAGSVLKPFFYAQAFQNKLISPATLISDSAVEFVLDGGRVYAPENYDHRFHGEVSARVSLASSLNIPTVRVVDWLGVEPSLEILRRLNIHPEIEKDEYYGPSLALGSIDVSLFDVTNAYRTLANSGVSSRAVLNSERDSDRSGGHRVFSSEVSWLVSNILSDREARSLTFGLENNLSTSFWTAVKTGTSKDMRDNWCVGYSQDYTVGVWVGNADGTPMQNVLGITGAGPIWAEVIRSLHEKKSSRPPRKPPGVLAAAGDFYLKGMPLAGGTMKRVSVSQNPKISYPQQGMVFAVDPEIPTELQKIWVESTEGDSDDLVWEWNGRRLTRGQAREGLDMVGLRGKQTLKLLSKIDQRVQDSVEIILKSPK